MDRRTALKRIAGLGVTAAVAPATLAPVERETYGLVRAGGNTFWTCTLDGRDISMRCRAAHDVEGWAEVYVEGPEGRILTDASGPLWKRVYGDVVLRPKEAS